MFSTLLAVLLALSMAVEINVGSRLMLADLLSITIVAVALLLGLFPRFRRIDVAFVFFTIMWLTAQVLTDVFLDISADRYARYWSIIGMYIVHYLAIRVLSRNSPNRAAFLITVVLCGASLKIALGQASVENLDNVSDAWKFGYGATATAVLVFLSTRSLGKVLGSGVSTASMAFLSIIHLMLNARSLFGEAALAAILASIGRGSGRRRMGTPMLVIVGCLLAVGGYATLELYSYSASQGYLGEVAREKYERQANNNLGLIASGRTELLGSLDAIYDSPIIGYGSEPHSRYYAAIRIQRMRMAGMPVSGKDLLDDRIPLHSYLFSAWVCGGIVGAVYWLWVLIVVVQRMTSVIRLSRPDAALVFFIGITLCWDILFSPFGLDRRLVVPAQINLIFALGSGRRVTLAAKAKQSLAAQPTRTVDMIK